jgi:hypothetical protein
MVQLVTLTASSRSVIYHFENLHIDYVCTYIVFIENIYSLCADQCSNSEEHIERFKPTYINSYATYIASL